MADARSTQQMHAETALEMLRDKFSGNTDRPENTPTPDEGMVSTPRPDYPPSGAFDAEGREPALRRSRER